VLHQGQRQGTSNSRIIASTPAGRKLTLPTGIPVRGNAATRRNRAPPVTRKFACRQFMPVQSPARPMLRGMFQCVAHLTGCPCLGKWWLCLWHAPEPNYHATRQCTKCVIWEKCTPPSTCLSATTPIIRRLNATNLFYYAAHDHGNVLPNKSGNGIGRMLPQCSSLMLTSTICNGHTYLCSPHHHCLPEGTCLGNGHLHHLPTSAHVTSSSCSGISRQQGTKVRSVARSPTHQNRTENKQSGTARGSVHSPGHQ